MHARTHTRTFHGSLNFVRDNPGEPVPEETFTHSHLLWSSIMPHLLHPSNTIHGILPVQTTCLTVFFHNLSVMLLLKQILVHIQLTTIIFLAHYHTQPNCAEGLQNEFVICFFLKDYNQNTHKHTHTTVLRLCGICPRQPG